MKMVTKKFIKWTQIVILDVVEFKDSPSNIFITFNERDDLVSSLKEVNIIKVPTSGLTAISWESHASCISLRNSMTFWIKLIIYDPPTCSGRAGSVISSG